MKSLSGEFRNNLDEKGRISIPAKLRASLEGVPFVLTQSIDSCLWLFPVPAWQEFEENLTVSGSPFDPDFRLVQRRLIAPAQEIEPDRLGRIAIPQSLRTYAKLSGECVVLGMSRYIEIWDAGEYEKYLFATAGTFAQAAAGFSSFRFGPGA